MFRMNQQTFSHVSKKRELNVQETFRRHTWRFLKICCPFNLSSVPKGIVEVWTHCINSDESTRRDARFLIKKIVVTIFEHQIFIFLKENSSTHASSIFQTNILHKLIHAKISDKLDACSKFKLCEKHYLMTVFYLSEANRVVWRLIYNLRFFFTANC